MSEQQPTLDLQEIAEDDILAEEMGRYYADPLGFVYAAFDWDSPELREFGGPDVWATETLEHIGEKVRENKFDGKTPVSAVRVAISSGHGIGKGHPLSYIINAPCSSKRRWGDMKVGDYVFGADGKKTKIVATRHYRKEHYEVIFDDRSSTIVSGEHEWQVRGRQERRKQLDTWRILTTEEIIRLGVQRSNGISTAKQWEIPTQKPVEYEDQEVYDPYLIGVWIGDGGKGSGRITSIDPCFLTRLEEKNIRFSVRTRSGTEALSIYVYGFVTELDKIKLRYCGSSEKFIPDCYKYNSVEKRLELLRGLLDTDGEVDKKGSMIYSTVSLQLAKDIVWLARSLGGKARISPTVKKPFYTGKNGEKIRGKDCYRCTLTMPVGERYFYLERKQERLKKEIEHRYLTRWISEIKPVGMVDGMCIEVDNADHLYLTNDFIVTHNSVMTSWLILWIMSTRPFCKGIVTANSYTQLETKTWAELGKWLKRCVTGHWFIYNASKQSMRLRHKDHLENWRFDAQSCVEANSESFAGLHAVDSTPCFIFDEASAVADKIFEVAEGGLTDGEPMIFLFGNPTRNTGKFHSIFHKERAYWYTKQVDSRTVKITNKKLIKEWEELWGEDSDFFRVRVKGEFPRSSSLQLISTDSVRTAQQRTLDADVYDWEVRIMAIDIARYGDDSTVFTFRQGRKLYKQIEYRELDLMKASSLAVHYSKEFRAEVIFIDGAGVGGGVVDRCSQLGLNVVEVNGGAKADESKTYFNKRAEMYVRLRDWLKTADIPDAKESDQLFTELTSLEFGFSPKNQLILERKEDLKKRLGFSPDFADSLAMTFAYLVTVDEYRQSAIEEEEKMVRSPYQGR